MAQGVGIRRYLIKTSLSTQIRYRSLDVLLAGIVIGVFLKMDWSILIANGNCVHLHFQLNVIMKEVSKCYANHMIEYDENEGTDDV